MVPVPLLDLSKYMDCTVPTGTTHGMRVVHVPLLDLSKYGLYTVHCTVPIGTTHEMRVVPVPLINLSKWGVYHCYNSWDDSGTYALIQAK